MASKQNKKESESTNTGKRQIRAKGESNTGSEQLRAKGKKLRGGAAGKATNAAAAAD